MRDPFGPMDPLSKLQYACLSHPIHKTQPKGHGAPACGAQSIPSIYQPVFLRRKKPLNRGPFAPNPCSVAFFVECISAVRHWGVCRVILMAPAGMRELVLEWRLSRVFL